MKLSNFDILLITLYLVTTVVIGLVLKKKAAKNVRSYLLGENRMPWYMLGLSNASGMFDISGTMWLVTLAFVYGLKSIWIPWLWPVFNQVFFMVFLSVWLRRSNVKTGAEWMGTRFGHGVDGKLAHAVVVMFALISCLGFLAYGFVGIGKFVEIFIPWESFSGYLPFHIPEKYVPHFYGAVFTLFAVFYSVLGGLSGIVWADVIQYLIMTVAAIAIGLIAMDALVSHPLAVPEGWINPFFGNKLDIDWTGIIDEVNLKINSDGYSLFSIFFMMMIFKGFLVSLAGPSPSYDMQKILSAKSPKDAAKMSGFVSLALMPSRYFMIAGFAVLGLIFYHRLDLMKAGEVDFERILPAVISEFVPAGLTGLILAGLLAAFMSTFAGTLNAAQAYLVNDIYLKYINPLASSKRASHMNYASGLIVVITSIVLGLYIKNINSILHWIVSALWGSYVASNVLKWYWWRFNGKGYFWGMLAGILPALVFPVIFPRTLELYYFPVILLISFIGCIAGTFAGPPTDPETLKSFYKTVRPWGFWKPVYILVKAEDPAFERNTSFKKDMFNVVIGIIAQTALVVLPIYLVLMQRIPLIISLIILAICSIILKKTWWDRLESEKTKIQEIELKIKLNEVDLG